MADTFVKIATVTVGSGGASSIDFTSIPSTYTDLVIKLSARDTSSNTNYNLIFNNDSSAIYDTLRLYGNGSSAFSDKFTNQNAGYIGWQTQSTYTANTFSNNEVYIPNYAGSSYKSVSNDGVSENNATAAQQTFQSVLWGSTAAINRITISQTMAQHTTATLYGIKSS